MCFSLVFMRRCPSRVLAYITIWCFGFELLQTFWRLFTQFECYLSGFRRSFRRLYVHLTYTSHFIRDPLTRCIHIFLTLHGPFTYVKRMNRERFAENSTIIVHCFRSIRLRCANYKPNLIFTYIYVFFAWLICTFVLLRDSFVLHLPNCSFIDPKNVSIFPSKSTYNVKSVKYTQTTRSSGVTLS